MKHAAGSRLPLGSRVGLVILATVTLAGALAPWLSPHHPHEQFPSSPYAPPIRPRLVDSAGRWHLPFVYPVVLVDRLERRYEEDRTRRIPLFSLTPEPRTLNPFFLGTDPLGRDVLSRLLYGARASLGIAFAATLGALLLGTLVGAIAALAGGWIDEAAMRVAEFVLVLPAIYVVLALRAVMPLVLSPLQVFTGLSIVLALAGWPIVARGVRAILMAESRREYVEAAKAAGAGTPTVLVRHLLPAARGFLGTQAALLVPAFVLAEATLSFVGFGFPEPVSSWGTMLRDAGHVRSFGEFPWLLLPAAAITAVTLAVNLLSDRRVPGRSPVPF